MKELLNDDYFILVAMSLVICILTQIIKFPIKHFTDKIKSSKKEGRITTIIMLIPLILGIVINFFFNTYYLHIPFAPLDGLTWGSTSIVLYNAIKRVLTGNNTSEADKKAEQAVNALVQDIKQDGQLNAGDIDAVKEYFDYLDKK